MTDPGMLTIGSTRGPDDEPVCELAWAGSSWYAPVADVRTAALDALSCAAYAEMLMLLAGKLKLPGPTASALITDLLRSTGRTRFGTKSTVGLLPAGSTKTGEASVLITRGNTRGSVSAEEARKMALRWLVTAEGTESDQLLSEALRGAGIGADTTGRVFGYLQELRR